MRRIASASVAVLFAVALTACSDSKPPSGASDSAFNPFATDASSAAPGPPAPPATLAVGDCFNSDQFTPGLSIDPRGVHLVACAEPHQHEVYAIERNAESSTTPFPGDQAMSAFADDVCLGDFEPALGVDYRQSSLDFATITPDATSWAAGDRSVICVVHDADFAALLGSRLATTTTMPASASTSTSLASEGG
ncbi:MAG: hypothetical protein QOI95_1466 [Acidimicrobiaceae bacterium]|jgi:hypothetical protein